jgi:hypothetical protein
MNTRYLISSLGLALALALSGCETVPTQPIQIQRTQASFSASKNRVWPLLVSQVGLEYPVRAIEKDSGLITTDWVNLSAGFNNMNAGNWVIRPGGFLATWNGLRMNMKIMAVETEPGKTQVTINCHYEAFEDNVQHAWLVVNSNGAIEDAILTKIESQLLTAPQAPEPSPVTMAAPATKSTSEALLDLKKLLDAQAITPAEYEAKKKILIEKL